ncbi:hypothetical protein EYF80_034122 [Liparis tanakae]|uniref:Uncharacterized protein n=1 Tax=Liparis tanakae TaxID=230148 RepID=A0A4Z2GQ47_9TELE|nr:hypothetical protein EYF80_034122 [Liparis tanakae]
MPQLALSLPAASAISEKYSPCNGEDLEPSGDDDARGAVSITSKKAFGNGLGKASGSVCAKLSDGFVSVTAALGPGATDDSVEKKSRATSEPIMRKLNYASATLRFTFIQDAVTHPSTSQSGTSLRRSISFNSAPPGLDSIDGLANGAAFMNNVEYQTVTKPRGKANKDRAPENIGDQSHADTFTRRARDGPSPPASRTEAIKGSAVAG